MKKCGICGYDITGYEAECWSGIYDRVHVSCCARKLDELYHQAEVSPQEAKPSEEISLHWICPKCGKSKPSSEQHGITKRVSGWCDECENKKSEPPAESTEVEEVKYIKSLTGNYDKDWVEIVTNLFRLTNVVNRLAKEIKLKKKKDGL